MTDTALPKVEPITKGGDATSLLTATINTVTGGPQFNPKYAESGKTIFVSLVIDVFRALIIAWGLDVVRQADGMGWLPQVTWWHVFLILVILAQVLGSVTEAVMACAARWWTQ